MSSLASVPTPALAAQLRPPCDVEIVIPAYNEERRLPLTLRRLTNQLLLVRDLDARVVVVDNGSADRTAEVVTRFAESLGRDMVTLVGCAVSGKGAAVQRGILTSRARFVGFMDADLAVPSEAVHDVMSLLLAGQDVVIGSRRCPGGVYEVRQPPVRRIGSWAFRRAMYGLVPGVADTQCGFKFFSAAAARRIFAGLNTAGFSFDVEVLVTALRAGFEIREVPVVWRDKEASTLRPLTDGPQILREIIRLRREAAAAQPGAAAGRARAELLPVAG